MYAIGPLFLAFWVADELPKQPIDRVPLIYWLLTWQASHHKIPLRCQITPQGDTRLPAIKPSSHQESRTCWFLG